jgi:hypothetical protein
MSEVLRSAPKRQLIEFGSGAGQVRHADDAAYSDARVPTCHAASHGQHGSDPVTPESIGAACACHKHSIADLTGVAAERHSHRFEDLAGVAAQKHRHDIADLDGVAPIRHAHTFEELSGVAPEKHRHTYEELSGVAPTRHTHAADEIVEGVFAVERVLAAAKPGAFLRVSEDGKSLETVDLTELAAAVRALLAAEEAPSA